HIFASPRLIAFFECGRNREARQLFPSATGQHRQRREAKNQSADERGNRTSRKTENGNPAPQAESQWTARLHGDAPALHHSRILQKSRDMVLISRRRTAGGEDHVRFRGPLIQSGGKRRTVVANMTKVHRVIISSPRL